MDVKDIIAKVSGNKDLVEQIKKADPKQVKGLLDKAGVKVDESDAKAVKAALSDGYHFLVLEYPLLVLDLYLLNFWLIYLGIYMQGILLDLKEGL